MGLGMKASINKLIFLQNFGAAWFRSIWSGLQRYLDDRRGNYGAGRQDAEARRPRGREGQTAPGGGHHGTVLPPQCRQALRSGHSWRTSTLLSACPQFFFAFHGSTIWSLSNTENLAIVCIILYLWHNIMHVAKTTNNFLII